MIGLVLALALAVQVPLLSPEAAQRIAPVVQAIEAEKARQATLPPPVDDRERLERMGALDQAGRTALIDVDLSTLPPDEIPGARAAMWGYLSAVDADNAAALLTMVPDEGWFYRSVWGDRASSAAFLIVQHSNLGLWQRFVPVLEPLVATGEVDGGSYALMYDRLAINEGRPQRYGSQMICRDGQWVVDTLEDPEQVDERRRQVGLPTTLAEYQAYFATMPPCT